MDGKLYYNGEINITFQKVFTGKLRTEIQQIIKDNTALNEKLIEKRDVLIEKLIKTNKDKIKEGSLKAGDIDNNVMLQLVADGDINIKDFLHEDPDKYLKMVYKLAQVIIAPDTWKHIKDEKKREKIKSFLTDEIDGDVWDFWNDQDLEMLEKAIEFFRSKIKSTI